MVVVCHSKPHPCQIPAHLAHQTKLVMRDCLLTHNIVEGSVKSASASIDLTVYTLRIQGSQVQAVRG